MIHHKKFLNGTLTTILLALLKEHGKLYGYEICKLTKAATDSTINLTEGAIYPALHKLEKEQLITSTKAMVNGRTRKYYAINESSVAKVTEQIDTLSQFLTHINKLIQPAI